MTSSIFTAHATIDDSTQKTNDVNHQTNRAERHKFNLQEEVIRWLHLVTNEANWQGCQTLTEHLSTLSTLLKFFQKVYLSRSYSSKDTGSCGNKLMVEKFVADVIGNYVHTTMEDCTDASWDDLWLCSVAKWLGKHFQSLAEIVGEKIEDFKTTNIANIDNLMSQQLVIYQLFPQCMRHLFEQWLNYHPNMAPTNEKPAKQRKLSLGTDTVLPLVQLILELSNGALVSGVAHVVYSRMIHT